MRMAYTDKISHPKEIERVHQKNYEIRNQLLEGMINPYQGNIIKASQLKSSDEKQEDTKWADKVDSILEKSGISQEVEKMVLEQKRQEEERRQLAHSIISGNLAGQNSVDKIVERGNLAKEVLRQVTPQTNIDRMIDDEGR